MRWSQNYCSDSPCSPGRDAYSLDDGQDALEEKDEEEGHEVERAVGPVSIMKKKENTKDVVREKKARFKPLSLRSHILLPAANPLKIHITCFAIRKWN